MRALDYLFFNSMIGRNVMNKQIQRIANMSFNNVLKLSALSIFLLAGCSNTYTLWGTSDDVTYREEVVHTDSTPVAPMVTPPEEPALRRDANFVDYRQTAADYREYGERTPQDQYFVNGGAGSNMSASIPPTIEEEVTDYEDAVNSAITEAELEAGESSAFSGDDAVEDWLAEEGSTLKGLLSDWCERAGWRLVWNSNRNYTLAAGAMFRGRFADVSSALIRNFARAKPAPMATFYKGNRVLVVETREDENAYN